MVKKFLTLCFGITWIAQLPFMLAAREFLPQSPLWGLGAAIGACGPGIAAAIVARDGAQVLGPKGNRQRWRWLPIALLTPALLHLLPGLLVSPFVDGVLVPYYPALPPHLAIAILAPLGEEPGWRGFLQRNLQSTMSPARASLYTGVAWSLWHLPQMFAAPLPVTQQLTSLVFVVALGPIFGWLFNRSHGSVLVAIAAHLGLHLDNVARGGGAALLVTTIAAVLVALVLLAREPSLGTNASSSTDPTSA